MATYVRPRRPAAPPPIQVRFVQDPTFHVQQATMIPDGMHGAPLVDASMALASTMRKLVAAGVRPERARALVTNAHRRISASQGNNGRHTGQMRKKSGLGDDSDGAAALLAQVQQHGADVQQQHADLIAKIPDGQASGDLLKIRNAVEALYNDWTDYAVGVRGVPPAQWNRTDPVDAILIAVRDDLRNTADLLAANKAQQVLAKQIAALPKLGTSGFMPNLNIDLPWYVWAGAAAGGAAVLGKTLHLW